MKDLDERQERLVRQQVVRPVGYRRKWTTSPGDIHPECGFCIPPWLHWDGREFRHVSPEVDPLNPGGDQYGRKETRVG